MAFKGIITAGAMALSMAMAVVAAPAPAEAKTKVVIGIGTGYGGCWKHHRRHCGWGYHPRVVVPIYGGYRYPKAYGKVGCGTAKDVLRGNGYNNIVAKDCGGTKYTFKARKNGHRYLVRFNAVNGHIIGRSPL